jgi:exodeoxyribonuclease III
VAILSRNTGPRIGNRLSGDSRNDETHYIEAMIKGVIVTSLNLLNGNPQPGSKFDWFGRLRTHAATIIGA